ncbi:MAG TPA: acyl-CoA dehydrogenase family protein [Geminicoccus sp.]|jgi:acyl-CoA dehydrogenase|uniref:acyl-CoA dehydrogenase family protein n=1 Tax=Geminicoccus sp. TaxID=2024832 RepID=UPI002E2EE695|nr:acyl-CoA dehydrogenase family protein [Geminicoccus sp.]HEX2524829.1 acyl-CoA dehydrogenase family protein [Geminicoccus sp.]
MPSGFQTQLTAARRFVDDVLLPLEADPASFGEGEHISHSLLQDVRAQAKERGLWAPQVAREHGGLGFTTAEMAAFYEELGRSRFGPVACNCAPPDDGNMIVLQKVATPEQQQRWLLPIVRGDVRSSIVMTEPAPGSGSDPAGMMLTRAEKKGDRWVVNGHKWYITGAEGAAHFLLLARTSDDPRRGLTCFLFDKDQPGWHIVRRIPIMGPEEHGGHCELRFEGLEIPEENVLMGVGLGMKVTQIRLATARLTHCMRWLGMARRALEIALPYVREREAFGTRLVDKESIQMALGRVVMAIDTGRLLTMRAAQALDRGEKAQAEVSMAKIQVADTLHLAVDTAIQLMGANGYSKDTPLEWMYRYARQARLVDGASEVHQTIVARSYLAAEDGFFRR